MATTTNFGWSTPDNTDLVKDGALAIRTLGSAIDTSMGDLRGGTSGQILAKNSNTDMDFVWIANDQGDITAVTAGTGISGGGTTGAVTITNSMATAIDAKGDLIVGTGADTFDRLAVGGSNGDVLTVDSATSTGLKWASPTGGSGINKNYLINGGFSVAQRGTSFTSSGGANNDDSYTLDRWYILSDTNDVVDVTQETSVVPTNGQFAIALDVETINKKFGIATIIEQRDCVSLIGNTVTFSFKAKVSSTTKLDNVKAAIVSWSGTADSVTSDIVSAWNAEGTNPTLIANATYENTPANLNLTTSYATYSVSGLVDTASAKNIILFIWSDVTDTTLGDFLYISEAKLETGSAATAFELAGGTFDGELAACQRYGYGLYQDSAVAAVGVGWNYSTTQSLIYVSLPRTMRAVPTVTYTTQTAAQIYNSTGTGQTTTAMSGTNHSKDTLYVLTTVGSGLVAGNGTSMVSTIGSSQILFASAEL